MLPMISAAHGNDGKWAGTSIAIGVLTSLSAIVTFLLSLGNAQMILLALEGMRGFHVFFGIAIMAVFTIGVALVAGGVAALRSSEWARPCFRVATALGVVLGVMGLLIPGLFVFPRTSPWFGLEGGALHAQVASTLGWRVASFCLQAAAYPVVLLVARRELVAAPFDHIVTTRRWVVAALVLTSPAFVYCGVLLLGPLSPMRGLSNGPFASLVGIAFVVAIVTARFAWVLVLVCAVAGTMSARVGWIQKGILWALSILALVSSADAIDFR